MTERESFVASMRDNPADDTARLAFADWLDDRGEHDRAELIRVQVARARLNPRPVLRVFHQFNVTAPVHGGREFRGDFLDAPGLMLTPGLTFDAVMSMAPGEPLKTKAVGCVIEQFGPPISVGETIWLAGHVTGIPCPVRPEADALDERAAALMLRIPFGEFCPATFNWFVDAERFERFARFRIGADEADDLGQIAMQPSPPAGAVLVRRGFAEHVRCSWEDWLRWADWFRANHPCERVTLTTVPQWEFRHQEGEPTVKGFWKGCGQKAQCELPIEFFQHTRVHSLTEYVTREFCRRQWRDTTFALPEPAIPHIEAVLPLSNEFNQYTALLFGTIAQGLGIPPNLINGSNGT